MRRFTTIGAVLLLTSATAGSAFAQYPGESKASPSASDVVGNMKHGFGIGAPHAKVREVQEALRDKGYYTGPIDGVLGPDSRRAIWNFQRDKGLPRTASLDPATMAALELAAGGSALPGPTTGFGASEPSSRSVTEAP